MEVVPKVLDDIIELISIAREFVRERLVVTDCTTGNECQSVIIAALPFPGRCVGACSSLYGSPIDRQPAVRRGDALQF